MPSVTDSLTKPEMLNALDPGLPFLAAQAAIELDNLLLGRSSPLEAVKLLAERMRNASENTEAPEGSKTLMDLSTVEVFSSALHASQGQRVQTLIELTREAWTIAGALDASKVSQPKEVLQSLRAFCVALSRCASSYRQSILDIGYPESSWG